MAYAINDDKSKANIVVLSKELTGTGSMVSYTGQWSELEALGVDASDFANGKWAILSISQISTDIIYSDGYPPTPEPVKRARTPYYVEDTGVHPIAVFYPETSTAYGSPHFYIEAVNTSESVTVTVILMKIA